MSPVHGAGSVARCSIGSNVSHPSSFRVSLCLTSNSGPSSGARPRTSWGDSRDDVYGTQPILYSMLLVFIRYSDSLFYPGRL